MNNIYILFILFHIYNVICSLGPPDYSNIIKGNKKYEIIYMPKSTSQYPNRVYPNQCKFCVNLIEHIKQFNNNITKMMFNAQVYYNNEGMGSEILNVNFKDWEGLRSWLKEGGLITSLTPNATVNNDLDSNKFCATVSLCGGGNSTQYIQEKKKDEVIAVRFKLDTEFTPFKTHSPLFKPFVSSLIHEVAALLDINPHRLELHVHPNDQLVEIIILPGDKGRSPLELAHKLQKKMQDFDDQIFHTSNHILALFDNTYKVQLFTVNIPVTSNDEKHWGEAVIEKKKNLR